MGKSLTLEIVLERFRKKHGDKFDYSKFEFVNTTTPSEISCPVHGSFQQYSELHLASKHGCPKCGLEKKAENRKRLTPKVLISRFKEAHPDKGYTYGDLSDPSNIQIFCPDHGEFHQNHDNHYFRKSGCPECKKDVLASLKAKTTDEMIESMIEKRGNEYDYSKVDWNSEVTNNVEIICRTHGSFFQTPSNHYKGAGCPKCRPNGISGIEVQILNTLGSMIGEPLISGDRKILGNNKEIDIHSKSRMISLEYNGNYWHKTRFDKTQDDLEKAEIMREKGFTHYALDESDIPDLDKILRGLVSNRKSIYARKLEIKKVSNKECQEFLDEYHYQGNVGASEKYGLFTNEGVLVQVMTFGKSRFSKDFEWEIIRLCTHVDFKIVGGASRLWKAFIREYSPNSVVSYSDNKFFDGNVYEGLGFSYAGNTASSYIWNKGGEYLKRYRTMKHKLPELLGENFDPILTEKENMENNGYRKISDLGNKKWVWISN